jgi:hypothetical protein
MAAKEKSYVPKPKAGVVAKGNPTTAKKVKKDGMKKPGKC